MLVTTDQENELGIEELAIIECAGDLLPVPREHGVPRAVRRQVLRALMEADPVQRRHALSLARSRNWVDRFAVTQLHVLVFDSTPSLLRRIRFAESLARGIPVHSEVIGEFDGLPVMMSWTPNDFDTSRLIFEAAASQDLPLRGEGSAVLTAGDEDIVPIVSAARMAAEVGIAIPDATLAHRAESLGGWALLHSVARSRSTLALASPAAEALCGLTDPMYRQTVEVYLDAAGSPREACERLHIHRTTLYYRLDHLPEIVRDALADGLKRSTLHLALKLDRLWAATGVA